jgi:SAM-dependent methyltransferase
LEVPLDEAATATAAPDAATGAYYDRLARWTGLLQRVGYGGGRRELTAHRALADPKAGGRPTVTRLHDVLAAALPSPLVGHVLDAGCGMGGTMLDLAARGSAAFTGLTLSTGQAAIARRAIARAGLGSRLTVLVRSYDDPPEGPFDLGLAIESLAHSPDPAVSIGAIAARLKRGGSLAIVDDMPEPSARGSRDLALFQWGWRLRALWGFAQLADQLEESDLTIVAEQDLTAEVRPRTERRIAQLEAVNRALSHVAPSAGIRAVLDSYRGGLALERLYRHSLMRYRLLIATKR